jgi:hypothetical protein
MTWALGAVTNIRSRKRVGMLALVCTAGIVLGSLRIRSSFDFGFLLESGDDNGQATR